MVAKQFRYWVVALGMLLPIAPYEVYCIFPSNDRIKEIGRDLRTREKDELRGEEAEELDGLFTKWQWRNGIRFVTPVVASVVGLLGVLQQ